MHRLKSQSAMEYLMTYGWAILIVAVVLGALFELGIFSGTTFGGNACIPASGYLCNNPVLSTNGLLSVSFGEVGYQITITGVSCSTNSTAPSSFQSADILMESGQIENLNFNCPLPSNQLDTPFSGYLFIEYNTLNYPTQVVRFATVATKALLSGAPSAASSSISNVPITLSNAQGVPTPAPFQQMISFNPSSYSSYESADLGNIRFYQGSTELYSWCESGCTNSSSDAVFWVNLPSGISANSNTVINMDFESVGANYDGVFAGEAPQLSPTYGEYDNGADVFTKYGGGGSNGWSQFTFVGGTWTTVNGYLQQISTSGGYAGGPTALIESTVYPNSGSYVIGMAFNYTTKADARVGIVAVATPTTAPDTYAYRFIGQQGDNGVGFLSFLNDMVAWVVDNSYQGSVSTPYTMVVTDAAGTWSGSLYSGYGEGTAPLTSLSPRSYTAANDKGATSGYVGISAAYYSGSVSADPVNIMWFYLRAYPPGGVMPGASFG